MTNTEPATEAITAYLHLLDAQAERQLVDRREALARAEDRLKTDPLGLNAMREVRLQAHRCVLAERFREGGLAEAVTIAVNWRDLIDSTDSGWSAGDAQLRAKAARSWLIAHETVIATAITERKLPDCMLRTILGDLICGS